MKTYVIIGSGIGGIVTAFLCKKTKPDSNVILIEKSHTTGGLLAGTYYQDQNLYFDIGTHIPRQTGHELIDDFLTGSVDKDNLIIFDRGKGDICGSYFNNKLQEFSHFPDIRNLPNGDKIFSELKSAVNENNFNIDRSLYIDQQSYKRFGKDYCKSVLFPVLENMYQRPVEELAGFSLELPGITRVVAHDMESWIKEVLPCESMRRTFSVPDQRSLPVDVSSPCRSFYVRDGGSRAIVDSWILGLKDMGVLVYTGMSVETVDQDTKQVLATDVSGKRYNWTPDVLFITTGVMGAAKLLNVEIDYTLFDRPMSHRVINLTSDHVFDTDLFYFYGLDPQSSFYRVTNYSAITGNKEDKRITVEVLGERAESDDELLDVITQELKEIGFLESQSLSFLDVYTIPTGFPVPTVRNLQAMQRVKKSLDELNCDGIVVSGVGSGHGLFFQSEIISQIIKDADEYFQ